MSGKVKSISGNVILFAINIIYNNPYRLFGFVDTCSSEKNFRIGKNKVIFSYLIFFKNRSGCKRFDTTYKSFFLFLKEIKIIMALYPRSMPPVRPGERIVVTNGRSAPFPSARKICVGIP